MTRDMPTEEAVAVLTDFLMTFGHEKRYDDAFSIAIEALEAEPIVRCGECKHRGTYRCTSYEAYFELGDNGYCSLRERKDEE